MNTKYIIGPILNVCSGILIAYGTYLTIKFMNSVLDNKGGSKYENNDE